MKIVRSSIVTACFTVAMFVSCNTAEVKDESVTKETEALLTNLKKQSKKGYMFGHHDGTLYGIGWKGDEGRSDVKSVCGDYPAVLSFDLGHIELGAKRSLDGISFDTIRQEIIRHYERGGMISISWHLDNPVTGGNSWDVTDTTVVKSVLEGGVNYDKFQGWLKNLADYLNSIETEEGVKVPILFRPWHEHTGSWFWWGQKLCTTQEYKNLWYLTEKSLKMEGVNNLLYAYSPGGDAVDYMERYPGDEYIDLIGFDTYQFGGEAGQEEYISKIKKNLAFLDEYSKMTGMPYAITETGYEGIPNTGWWKNVLEASIGEYCPAYVLLWRNAYDKENHYYAPYPGHLSSESFISFYDNPRSLFLNNIENLYK